jgi:predicted RNA-binding protein with PIN domain
MIYIIDANNLAGKLNLLGKNNFDQQLFVLIQAYAEGRSDQFILVYDGSDLMGDKIKKGNIIIVYTPRDSYYQSADDKIVEMAEDYASRLLNQTTVVVSDDREIWEKTEKIINQSGDFANLSIKRNLRLEKSTNFAIKIQRFFAQPDARQARKIDNKAELSDNDILEVNDELLKRWG